MTSDLSSFNTKNVVYAQDLLNGCNLLISLNIPSFNYDYIYSMMMYRNCNSLISMDLTYFNI